MSKVVVVCQNMNDDRIIPRMARALRDGLGWTLVPALTPSMSADVVYLSGYFEVQKLVKWPDCPVAAYMTHREEEPPGNAKAKLYDSVAQRVQLRIATCRMYAKYCEQFGPTVQMPAPLERDRFVIPKRKPVTKPVVGLSGYTYNNKRKGEDLVRGMLASDIAQKLEWRASGRGWPIPTTRYTWADMPTFYQDLDILVVPSRVEGIPMPPLEALACGVRIVIPHNVGLHDELPDIPGIYRYEKGDLKTLIEALEEAAHPSELVDPEQLRAATEPYSIKLWVQKFAEVFESGVFEPADGLAGIATTETAPIEPVISKPRKPKQAHTKSKRGIYCVAFGKPSRESARKMMLSAKNFMPDIPIALCAAEKIGPEDVLIIQPDSDVGGRRAKLKVDELAPAEWESILYLDADVEIVAPVYQYFRWIEDGWDLVICTDIDRMETLQSLNRKVTPAEVLETTRIAGSPHVQQYNGGVWAFRRNERTAAFFRRWLAEWERYGQRDQGALLRALHSTPLKIWLLGNEWNTFPKFTPNVQTAGLLHFPGNARRWGGAIPGRIDSPAAWKQVEQFEARQR